MNVVVLEFTLTHTVFFVRCADMTLFAYPSHMYALGYMYTFCFTCNQFSCENGPILLRVRSHDCIDGFSANFMGVKTSYDFLNKWNELTARSTHTPPEKAATAPSHSASHSIFKYGKRHLATVKSCLSPTPE